MSMSFKRFLSLALVFAMMFTMLPMTLAEDEQPVEPAFEEIFEEEPADEEPVEEEPVEEEPVDEEPVEEEPVEEEPVDEEPVEEEPVEEEPVEEEPVEEEPVEEEPVEEEPVEEEPVEEEPVEEEPVEEEPVEEEPVEEEPVEEEPVEEEPVEEEPVEEEPVEEEPVEEEPVEEEPVEEEPVEEEPVEEEPVEEEPVEEEPVEEEPVVDEEVAKVQAMIDALETEIVVEKPEDYIKKLKELKRQLSAIEDMAEDLTNEQLIQLNIDKYIKVLDLINDYYISLLPKAMIRFEQNAGTQEDPHVYTVDSPEFTGAELYSLMTGLGIEPAFSLIGAKGFAFGSLEGIDAGYGEISFISGNTYEVRVAKRTGLSVTYKHACYLKVVVESNENPATITIQEVSDNGSYTVNNSPDVTSIEMYAGDVTIVVTPAAGYYTEVTVNGEALAGTYKYTDIDSSILGVDNRNVFTGVLAVENEKEYAVVVTYAQAPALSVNEGAEIEYNFFYEVTEQVAEVKAEIIEKVITGESDIEADQLTVEVYQSTLVGDSYINIAGGLVTQPSFDEETETLRLTLNATDKYPARTAEVTVTLVEIRKETAITAKDVALVIEDAAEFTADAIKAKMIEAGAQVTGAEADVNNIAVAIPAEFAVPEKGQEATVVVTVSLAETGAYLAAESVTANVSVKHIYDNNNNDVDDAEELYTVTFDSNCDEVEDKVYASVQWNETVEIPVFIREAFNFVGWEPALTGTEFTVTAPAQGTEYLFTAQWTEAWVLNFDGNSYDGTVLVNKGETIEEVPADIWDENHDFLGWFAVDAEGTVAEEAFDFTQVIGGNMTFIAKWMNDFNKNDVADEEESIQIVVNKANDADAIEVVGAVEYAEGLYAYDSTLEEASVTVKAIPVMDAGYSVTYVDGVVIGDTAVNGAYADYAFTTESILVQKDMVIEVNFAVAEIIFNENPDYGFVHGYDTANIETIFAETIENPKATENSTISITYQARPSMTVSIELPEELNNILGTISSLIPNYDGKSISFDLPEAWASVDEKVPAYKDIETVTQEFYDALPDDLSIENIWNSLGGIRSAIGGVTESLTHYGKHEFGYDGAGSKELIRVTYSDERMNLRATDKEITIYDDRTPVTINANDVSVAYNSYTVESLIGLMNVSVVADDGADLGNDVSIKEIIEGKDVGEYEITLRYSGNETYGVANKTVTVTVVKAPSAIDYDSQTVVYGSDYSFNLVKSPSNLKAIEFIIGVDVAALDVSEEGVSGTKPTMWLEIPESVLGIAGLLIPDEGTVVDLNGLRDILDGIANMGDLVGGLLDNETINQLFDGIDSIMGMLNLSDLSIAINTGNKPSNIGIYLAGAVSADSNYETSYTVDYLLIVPNTEKVELEWLVNDDNFIVSLPLASNGEYLKAVVKERAEMNDSVKYLYVGYGADEEIKLYMSDDASIDVSGGYVQIAYILEWNNDIAYAIPLVRPVLVVPGYYNIQFVDEEGNPLTEYVTTFDNTEKAIETLVTDIDGNKVDIVPEVRYYGVQTNGKTYDSDIAPKHAGAYAVVASIIEKDEKDVITAAGLALGAMVIVPADTEVVAENAIVTYTGSDISFSDFYTVNTESTANFDMTVISASLADTGDFSKQGWAAVTGNVNVDFPAWIDRILSEMYPNDYADGVNAKDFADKIDEYAAKLNEIGVTNDVIDAIKAALNEIPDSLTLTFEDDKAVEGIGLFAFIAIVTDSDHIPSYDSGVIAVVPDVNVNYLKFNYEDANGIITEQLLKSYDLNASAYTDSSFSEKDEEATALVKNVFISVDENGFTFETDYTKLTNGAYIQISYIPGEISSDMHFARMIARSLLIVPDALEVTFEDAEGNVKNAFEFGYGEEIAIETVVSYEGTPIDTANGELTVRYIGFDKNGERYDSTDKPTEIGVYAVIATYVEKSEATGDVARIGANAASLVISIGTLEFELIDTVKHYDGEEKFVDMVNPYNADFVYVIVNRETKEVMIGLEEDAQAIYDEIVKALAEIGIELGNEYDVEKAIDAIECVIAKVECFFGCAMNEEQLAKLEELKGLLNAIDGAVSYITINGGKPTEKGVYDVYALSISENFKPVFDSAVLEIKNLEVLEIGEVWLSLNLESEVHVNVDFTVNGLLEETQPEDILEKLSLMIWNEGNQPETDAESVMEANPDTILTEVSYDAATGRYRIRTAGIAAKDMADVKYMKLAANNGEDGYNYSIRYKFSPKIYCDHVVTSNYGKELQDLCVALMNYGAAAQEYFHGKNGYQYDVAMNADGFYQDYELEAYDASLIDELAAINESKHGEFVYNGKFTRYDHYLSLEGAIALNFDLHYNGDASEAGLYVWSEKTYANASVLTKENAEKISASDMRYGSFKAAYAGNAAKEIGDTVYACAYAVIDGETYYSGIFQDSIEKFAEQISSGSYGSAYKHVAEDLVVYGEYARKYFKY